MLNGFDWLRRSRTGAELLATLKCLEETPGLFGEDEIGPPHSALGGLCQRCWTYPRTASSRRRPEPVEGRRPEPVEGQGSLRDTYRSRRTAPYCQACRAILARASRLSKIPRECVVIWAVVNQLPKQLEGGKRVRDRRILGAYIHDEHHFLVMMRRYSLKPWLQELLIYYGADLRGVIQILPTTGAGGGLDMADILCRAIHQELRFPMDQLRVRFFSAPHQLLRAHTRDRRGLLTFEVSEFLNLLEMAAIFRTLLYPEAQQALHDLLYLRDSSEEQFYWGRFLGYLSSEAKDMLSAWRIRQWPRDRIRLLYELVEYVAFYSSD